MDVPVPLSHFGNLNPVLPSKRGNGQDLLYLEPNLVFRGLRARANSPFEALFFPPLMLEAFPRRPLFFLNTSRIPAPLLFPWFLPYLRTLLFTSPLDKCFQ